MANIDDLEASPVVTDSFAEFGFADMGRTLPECSLFLGCRIQTLESVHVVRPENYYISQHGGCYFRFNVHD